MQVPIFFFLILNFGTEHGPGLSYVLLPPSRNVGRIHPSIHLSIHPSVHTYIHTSPKYTHTINTYHTYHPKTHGMLQPLPLPPRFSLTSTCRRLTYPTKCPPTTTAPRRPPRHHNPSSPPPLRHHHHRNAPSAAAASAPATGPQRPPPRLHPPPGNSSSATTSVPCTSAAPKS